MQTHDVVLGKCRLYTHRYCSTLFMNSCTCYINTCDWLVSQAHRQPFKRVYVCELCVCVKI